MIDIVVMYCNDKDSKWLKAMNDCMKKEGSFDRQVIGEERYRDWDCFKYWFRSVETNCKWFNKIFLIVASPSQLPHWLDTSNPRLRVVYHDEFIPKELLPTYNSCTIELYIDNIKDLSNNYVFCNDDFYFINDIPQVMFFNNNLPVYNNKLCPLQNYSGDLLNSSDATFYKILNNCNDFRVKVAGNKASGYEITHLPVPNKKDFGKEILDKYADFFIQSQGISKFRHKNNVSRQLLVCLYRDLNPYFRANTHHNSSYVTLKSTVNFDDYIDKDMVCFNDTEQLDDFDLTKKHLVSFLEKRFPNKSSFELEN